MSNSWEARLRRGKHREWSALPLLFLHTVVKPRLPRRPRPNQRPTPQAVHSQRCNTFWLTFGIPPFQADGWHMAHRVQKVVIHGHERAFVKIGTGPALLLLH